MESNNITPEQYKRLKAKAYYKANREKLLAYSKKWNAEHPEWCKKRRRKWRENLTTEQKLKLSKYFREYYRKNIEKFKAYRKKS